MLGCTEITRENNTINFLKIQVIFLFFLNFFSITFVEKYCL
jgi:hypothetical protein